MHNQYPTLQDTVGNTPLIKLQRIGCNNNNLILAKLEGNNPAGSVKDRPALNMILQAEIAGQIQQGDTLIEATSGNTGIALAMVAAIRGYKMILVMPDDLSKERWQTMAVYGAEIVLTPAKLGGMEYARDVAIQMEKEGKGKILGQFSNSNNPLSHYRTTAVEIWRQTKGEITHFVSSMGTTGTITGVSRYLKEQNPNIKIIGVQPAEGARIAGIRKWSDDYVPSIYDNTYIDEILTVEQKQAEDMAKNIAKTEGLFCGISSGGALHIAQTIAQNVENARIVVIICDRGDRYLSTNIFSE
ncbi:MAG: Cysteine synthase [Pseudomonadota bacterium]|jgi:cysteine synthase B